MTVFVCVREETDAGTAFSVAVATDGGHVGALTPCVSHEVAISTQSFVNVRLGRREIELLSNLAVDDALDRVGDTSVMKRLSTTGPSASTLHSVSQQTIYDEYVTFSLVIQPLRRLQ